MSKKKNCFCMVSADIIEAVSGTEGGKSDDDEHEDDVPEMYTHRKLQTEFDRVVLNKEDWQGMVNRARLRGTRGARAPGEGDGEQRAPGPKDKIWEIGCQVCYY
jgi:hypothetical protein